MFKKKDQPKIVVSSKNQAGGITAHTVNLNSPPTREVSEEFAEGLIQELKSREGQFDGINICVNDGSNETWEFAKKIESVLKSAGYDPFVGRSQFFNPPKSDVDISFIDKTLILRINAQRT